MPTCLFDQQIDGIAYFEIDFTNTYLFAQTPEEIERWCTKEDMPEVKRCVHLMKKGYEIQKISVSNQTNQLKIANKQHQV